jgi:hypothetical protein
MNFSINQILEKNIWNNFLNKTNDSTIFSNTHYLDSLNIPYNLYLIKQDNQECLAGICVLKSNDNMYPVSYPFTPYSGILFSIEIENLNKHKKNSLKFKLTEFIIDSLVQIYGNFETSFGTNFFDLRPFQWYNYGGDKTFQIKIRYTGILDLENFNLDTYLKQIRTVRRQEYKKYKGEYEITENIDSFINLYKQTFKRQEISLDDSQLKMVRDIVNNALINNYGFLSQSKIDGKIASMNLFIYDNHSAYYLFGANNPDYRNTGASTFLMIKSIQLISEMGLKKIDFIGINSPNRGDFKLSFNPKIFQYYEVKF